MTTISTRLATIVDLDAIAPLFNAYRQFYKQATDLPLARRFIQERLQRNESVVLVAEAAAGKIVGFCQLYPTFCSVRAAHTYVLYESLDWVRDDAFFVYGKSFGWPHVAAPTLLRMLRQGSPR